MGDTVLVMTDAEDYTADLVIAVLQERGMKVVRLDPGAGPIRMAATLTGSGWSNTVGDEHRALDLEAVVSVLWRWPTIPAGHPDIRDPVQRAWAAREDAAALFGVLKALPVRWINHPDRIAAADSKPGQLVTAAGCGLTVPRTLITSSGAAVRQWDAPKGELLYKAFFAQGTDENQMILASRVEPAVLPDELGAASIFQEVIHGQSVRVTVVGDRVFAAAISGTDALDWRTAPELAFTPIEPPDTVKSDILKYMRRYGLEYGAFDFVRSTETGVWVFLECNPSGMYGFVELKTGLKVTAAIADRLCEPMPE